MSKKFVESRKMEKVHQDTKMSIKESHGLNYYCLFDNNLLTTVYSYKKQKQLQETGCGLAFSQWHTWFNITTIIKMEILVLFAKKS